MKKFDYGYESEAAEDNWPEYYYLSQGDSTIMEHASYTELPRAASTYAAPQYPHYRAYEKEKWHPQSNDINSHQFVRQCIIPLAILLIALLAINLSFSSNSEKNPISKEISSETVAPSTVTREFDEVAMDCEVTGTACNQTVGFKEIEDDKFERQRDFTHLKETDTTLNHDSVDLKLYDIASSLQGGLIKNLQCTNESQSFPTFLIGSILNIFSSKKTWEGPKCFDPAPLIGHSDIESWSFMGGMGVLGIDFARRAKISKFAFRIKKSDLSHFLLHDFSVDVYLIDHNKDVLDQRGWHSSTAPTIIPYKEVDYLGNLPFLDCKDVKATTHTFLTFTFECTASLYCLREYFAVRLVLIANAKIEVASDTFFTLHKIEILTELDEYASTTLSKWSL